MKEVTLGLVFLLAGCSSLITERRMAKFNTNVQSIQRDLNVLSATFTPEQSEKYTRAKTAQDEPMFQEFYASLSEQQQAAMNTLRDRVYQVEQEWQLLTQTVQRDLALQQATRQCLAQDFSIPPSVP